jgi:predicted nuclease of predicted toxin-antitoxin system
MAKADDADILERGRFESRVVVTLDADFHALLARSGASGPSTIRFRIEGLSGGEIADRLHQVIAQAGADLEKGAVVSVTERGVRSRLLPLAP